MRVGCFLLSVLCWVATPLSASPISGLSREDISSRLALLKITEARVVYQSACYAEVRRSWVGGFLVRYQDELAAKGIGPSWRPTFNCLYYAMAFRVLAQEEYDRQVRTQQPSLPDTPTTLAIFAINYYRDTDVVYAKAKGWNGRDYGVTEPAAHAIVLMLPPL